MKRFLLVILMSALLTGCSSLVPQKVEFFQDKVQKFPEQSAALVELERQAIYRARDKTAEVAQVAVIENASTNVVFPAKEAAKLTEAVAVSLGPPQYQPSDFVIGSTDLAVKLEGSVAKYDKKVAKFKSANDENTGKKIEGTGIFQIGYFYWVGGILAGLAIIFIVGKLLLTAASAANPGAAVGLGVLNVAQSVITKGFSQLVKGGEDFKAWVEKEITDPQTKQKILDAFQTAHIKAQDGDVQNVVTAITK